MTSRPLNLASFLTAAAGRDGAAPALRFGMTTVSYGELDDRSARVATLLAERGMRQGDRVGMMIPNVVEFPVVYFGVLRAGGIVVPMNPLLKEREIAHHLADSEASLLFAHCGFLGEAQRAADGTATEVIAVDPEEFGARIAALEPTPEVAPTDAEDTAVIFYTSGTTGRPKGAELSHRNLDQNSEITSRTTFKVGAGDVVLGALPLFHAFGQTVALNGSLRRGACLTLLPKFDPGEALVTIGRDRVTHFYGVPTMFGALLHHPDRLRSDTSHLRLCVTGGASMPVEVLGDFEDAFGVEVLEGYGLSETSPVASSGHPDQVRKPGSIGTPIEGVGMRIVDEQDREVPTGEVGEIVIRGHNIMKGYWNRPDATAEAIRDGWFHSGDLGREDEDGYFFVVDRKKDMIIRGGLNVYPREVEEVLYEHPEVREAAVVGTPDDSLGEEVAAAIVLEPDASLTADRLREWVRERIAAYKYPRVIWFVEELPKGPTGKILKRELLAPEE